MAGDWIKMRKTIFSDPRIVRMMSALKADKFRTVGGLMSAWCLADDQTEDGRLDGYTPEVLDEMLGFPGLASAMVKVGWLIVEPESLVFPRFEEHNGKTAKRRAQDCVRKMSARDADKKRTREEKRREEKNTLSLSRQIQPQEGEEEKRGLLTEPLFLPHWQAWRKHLEQKCIALDSIQEDANLMALGRVSQSVEDACQMVEFSILKGARNLILNGDHRQPEKSAQQRSPKRLTLAETDL